MRQISSQNRDIPRPAQERTPADPTAKRVLWCASRPMDKEALDGLRKLYGRNVKVISLRAPSYTAIQLRELADVMRCGVIAVDWEIHHAALIRFYDTLQAEYTLTEQLEFDRFLRWNKITGLNVDVDEVFRIDE